MVSMMLMKLSRQKVAVLVLCDLVFDYLWLGPELVLDLNYLNFLMLKF